VAIPHPTNAILVGRKKVSTYVIAALRMLTHESLDEVIIKARGANIYKAVETALGVKRALGSINIKSISINSEHLKDNKGVERRVSAIEIVLQKAR